MALQIAYCPVCDNAYTGTSTVAAKQAVAEHITTSDDLAHQGVAVMEGWFDDSEGEAL